MFFLVDSEGEDPAAMEDRNAMKPQGSCDNDITTYKVKGFDVTTILKDLNFLQGREIIQMTKSQEGARISLGISMWDYLHQEEIYDENGCLGT